jgi:hypothetical protein
MNYKLYKTMTGLTGVFYTNEQGQMISFLLGLDNPEEKAYLKWLEEGNTPEPAENT